MKSPLKRGGLRFCLAGVALATLQTTRTSVLIGAAPLVAGVALHLWAKGCLRQNEEVTQSGPYRFVRHPFYAANGLVDLGIAMMSGWWPLPLVLPAWWLAVYLPVIRAEERSMTRLFPGAYAEYARRVGMLMPTHWPPARAESGFSLRSRNIVSGTEVPRMIRLLAYPFMFLLWERMIANRGAFFRHWDYAAISALAMLIAVHVVAWELQTNLKHGRRIFPEWLQSLRARMPLVVAIIVVGALVRHFETEDAVAAAAGAILAVASLAVIVRRPDLDILAEGLALTGLALLWELVWLAAAAMVVYCALALDRRLTQQRADGEGATGRASALGVSPRLSCFCIVGAGVAVAIAKEFIHG